MTLVTIGDITRRSLLQFCQFSIAGDQREKICMCNNFMLHYANISASIKGLTGDGSDDDNDDDSDHSDCL